MNQQYGRLSNVATVSDTAQRRQMGVVCRNWFLLTSERILATKEELLKTNGYSLQWKMNIETLDHEIYIKRTCELAREAGERDDDPYGSLLVHDGEVIMEETNRINTENDISYHPELVLARRAAEELEPEVVAETIMYTSTEPCSMCSTGMAYAGLGGVVYSVSGEHASELRGGGTGGIPCDEVFDRLGADITVLGPVLKDEGTAVHRSF